MLWLDKVLFVRYDNEAIMKTVILSDTHLSSKFYPKKFEYLKSIIEDADKVIIAGDFWDGFLLSFDDFVHSKWQDLFPLLLEKQAVYLYGNHDRPEWCDERVSLFSVEQGMNTVFDLHGRDYYVTHGHLVFESFEDKWPVFNKKLFLRLGSIIDVTHKFLWGKRFLKDGSGINGPMSRWVMENLSDTQTLICGHSHYPESNIASRFLNSGFIGLGYASHVLIDSEVPRIVRERY